MASCADFPCPIRMPARRFRECMEGYYAAESIYQLSQREGVEMPLCRSVYEVLYHGVAVQDVVSSLMRRAKKDELTETTWL